MRVSFGISSKDELISDTGGPCELTQSTAGLTWLGEGGSRYGHELTQGSLASVVTDAIPPSVECLTQSELVATQPDEKLPCCLRELTHGSLATVHPDELPVSVERLTPNMVPVVSKDQTLPFYNFGLGQCSAAGLSTDDNALTVKGESTQDTMVQTQPDDFVPSARCELSCAPIRADTELRAVNDGWTSGTGMSTQTAGFVSLTHTHPRKSV